MSYTCKHNIACLPFVECVICWSEEENKMANCIEADNEIKNESDRLNVMFLIRLLEKKIEEIHDRIFNMEQDINNIYCEKCHPKFDDNGIL